MRTSGAVGMETAAAAREAAAMATQYAEEGGREPLLFTLSSLLFASYIELCARQRKGCVVVCRNE